MTTLAAYLTQLCLYCQLQHCLKTVLLVYSTSVWWLIVNYCTTHQIRYLCYFLIISLLNANISDWLSSFLTAHQHITGHCVPLMFYDKYIRCTLATIISNSQQSTGKSQISV